MTDPALDLALFKTCLIIQHGFVIPYLQHAAEIYLNIFLLNCHYCETTQLKFSFVSAFSGVNRIFCIEQMMKGYILNC